MPFGPDLPWPVRWSGRLLMVEVLPQYNQYHQDFADYFVCRSCGQRHFVTAQRVVGVIGATPAIPAPTGDTAQEGEQKGDTIFVPLWSEAEKTAHNADIDRLEIREGNVENYERAVNAVINVLKNDVSRPANYLKKVPVVVTGKPVLSPGARRLLRDTFKSLQEQE